MSTNVHRGPLTDLLVTTMTTALSGYGAGIPVGDGIVPVGGGWVGEPNDPTSHYQPYVVIIAGTTNFSEGPIADSQSDWHFPYIVGSYNGSRKGTDWLADRARDTLTALRYTTVTMGADSYQIEYVRVESIGGTNRNDATDPPFWSQIDGISVWVSKEF